MTDSSATVPLHKDIKIDAHNEVFEYYCVVVFQFRSYNLDVSCCGNIGLDFHVVVMYFQSFFLFLLLLMTVKDNVSIAT